MVDVTYSLEGANGDVIVFDQQEFVLANGIIGFGISATNVRIDSRAGDGGTFRFSKRDVRDIDLPVVVFGDDRADVQAKLRRLNKILQDKEGPAKLRATYLDATNLFIEVHYVGGGETQWNNTEAGLTFARWVLQLRAPNPFWISGIEEEFLIATGSTGRGLLPELTKMKLSSPNALGSITFVNAGDVQAFPIYEITGPLNNLEVKRGTQSFAFAQVLAGETITIDTETASVTDQDGVNVYAKLSPAPKLFSLPPGESTVQVFGTALSGDFQVKMRYSPRFEVIH